MIKQIFFLIVLVFSFNILKAEPEASVLLADLAKADQAYQQHNYTLAYNTYTQILEKDRFASQRMIIRMAYCLEATGQYALAIYYLNLSYFYFPDVKVQKKIIEMAARYQLKGYTFSDFDYFLLLYNRYRLSFAGVVAGLAFLVLLINLHRKIKKRSLTYKPIIFFLLCGISFFLFNQKSLYYRGIFISPVVRLMSAPSAGATLISQSKQGHRCLVSDSSDIWYKIELNGVISYTLKQNIKIVGI